MSWVDALDGGEQLVEVFGGSLPEGPGRLVSLRVEPGASSLTLTYEPTSFPAQPPPQWHADANTVQLRLHLDAVSALSVAVEPGEPAEMTVSTSLRRTDAGVELTVTGDAAVTARADGARLGRVSAYQRDDR